MGSSSMSSLSLTSNRDQTVTGDSRQTVRKSRKVSTACKPCRNAKAKCDATSPCNRCQRKMLDCVYSEAIDGRRTGIIKQQRDEFRGEVNLLNNLLHAIRRSEDDKISRTIRLMGGDCSLDDVKAQLQHYLRNGSSSRLEHAEPSPVHEHVTEIRLTDVEHLDQLNCARWTNVTHDDKLVSHILLLWLTWDKPWYDWMDESLFLRDMRLGPGSTRYCSSFLVNAILAWATPYRIDNETSIKHNTNTSLMNSFITEARLHFEKDITCPLTLPTVQGLAFLFLALALSGQDRLAYYYLVQAAALCKELEEDPPIVHDAREQEILSNAIDRTCWGVLNVITASMISYMKPQIMRAPQRNKPEHSQRHGMWKPFPFRAAAVSCDIDELVKFHCEISEISATLTEIVFPSGNLLSDSQTEQILALHTKLSFLLSCLPDDLRVHEAAPAPVLYYHAWSQVVILRMFSPLSSSESHPALQQRARDLCIQAALEVARVCRIHAKQYGLSFINVMTAQASILALCVLLDAGDNPEHDMSIIDLVLCLRALSQRYPMVTAMVRMTQHHASLRGYRIPIEARRLLDDFEKNVWQKRTPQKLVSIYPQPAIAVGQPRNANEPKFMSQFLEQMESLAVNSSAVFS